MSARQERRGLSLRQRQARGDQLRLARCALQLSLDELAQRAKLSRHTIDCLEAGRGQAKPETVAAVCAALDISLASAPARGHS
jgi:DNA-binding XRE family transcriptional regulator